MDVKKLTGEEILERVEQVFGNNVEAFAYCDYTEADVNEIEGFEYDEEKAEAVGKVKNDHWEAIKDNLPNDYKERMAHPDMKAHKALPSKHQEKENQLLNFLGLGKVVEVKQYGGEEQGSTWYSIKHFVDHDVYIRTDGYYQSYHGTDFHDGIGRVVTPQQKTITVFE